MTDYRPMCVTLGRDQSDRTDQETWNLVGCDPTILQIISIVHNASYHLTNREVKSLNLIRAKLEERIYDRLSYD